MLAGIRKININARLVYLSTTRKRLPTIIECGYKDEFGEELHDKNILQAFAAAFEGMEVKWVILI
jgi:hypothetical protein